MPSVLTLTIGKKICENPDTDNHFLLRDLSASLIETIVNKFGGAFVSLQPRTAKALSKALNDRSKPLGSLYGAIIGITALGAEFIQALLLPQIKELDTLLEGIVNGSDKLKQKEAKKCNQALLVFQITTCDSYV